ncbi:MULTISPECIES: ABC transporter permease [Bradyrhizobium]|jgi:sulfonate transport system permease protein|uniref:ABC transporter permease n=1 Tax=Bradyrhizobium TaxID=374 RepID=UPI0004812F44|nr:MULTISPECIES: ABC transporter permease [Bradyrhizobium]MCS3451245.1 sulfonate transport system permease protein [Bradyrhizobium elkanii]MCS3566732.1 sulfonate transport system permease protein [Bradyrhizobium elkanii]MCW2152543.1 sulfonate transport system permease protein [Bradyrhizobium elkanii]MCW2357579.1 sulfonate transport system permease protein [Bradyrhizobium elkanii]MCW2376274.1 sulfonate transport system permease protein [Bradyrhizobium elkanii]
MSDAALRSPLEPDVSWQAGIRRIAAGRVGEVLARQLVTLGWLLILPAIALPIWVIGADRGWLPEQILPRPSDVLHTLRDMIASGELAQHAGYSLRRVAHGFAIGAGAGLVVGSAMGLSRRLDDYIRPLFTAIAQVPALAWIPLAMLLLGIGEGLKIVVIAKAAFVPVVMNTSAGIANVPKAFVEVGETFRFTPWQMLRHVVLPGAVPSIFTGLRYGLTHAWIALVSVELLASSEGLGYLLVWGRQMFWLDTVLVAMVVIGVIGFASDKVLAVIEARLQRWRIDGVR